MRRILVAPGCQRPAPRYAILGNATTFPADPQRPGPGDLGRAVKIIDAEGLGGWQSAPAGLEFGVKAPIAWYHHFADRAEIMAEVARAIVTEAAMPRRRDPGERVDRLVTLSVNFRRAGAAPSERCSRSCLSTRHVTC